MLEARRANPGDYDDFLADFAAATYKDGRPLDEARIMNYIMGLIFAGHETTSGQASWLIVDLLQHAHWHTRVRDEVDAVCVAGDAIALDTLARLPLLQAAMRESERMHPVTDMLLRGVVKTIEVDGYTVPAGWMALVSPPVAHRLPALFREPDAYDPGRFGPERNEAAQHRYSIITFGGGVHKCTGMNFAYNEMLMVAALLLQQFDLELATTAVRPQHGIGASRPTPAHIRYTRRGTATSAVPRSGTAAACPFHGTPGDAR